MEEKPKPIGNNNISQSITKQPDLETNKGTLNGTPTKKELPAREDENYQRFKLPYVYAFFETKNISINLRKTNNKTFLNVRLDYIHLNALGNIEFEKNHSMTFHMSGFRIFYYYSDTPKQIFAGNPKPSGGDYSRDQSMIQQDYRKDQNASIFKGKQSQLGSMNNVALDRSTRMERPTAHSHGKTKVTATNLGTDVVILEMKDSIIFKFNFKVLDSSAKSLQVRTEIGEIEVKIENAVVKDAFEYINDLRKNYSVRHLKLDLDLKKKLRVMRMKMMKNVVLPQSPEKTNILTQDSPQRVILQESVVDQSMSKQSPDRSNYVLNMSKNESAYMDIFKNKFQSYLSGAQTKMAETIIADMISPDPMNLFLRKLTHFFQSNELMVSININGIYIVISESAPQSVEKTEIMSVTIPKGKVFVSLNYNRKSLNLVDVYGFKVETSSKFQAIYSFVKVNIYKASNFLM